LRAHENILKIIAKIFFYIKSFWYIYI